MVSLAAKSLVSMSTSGWYVSGIGMSGGGSWGRSWSSNNRSDTSAGVSDADGLVAGKHLELTTFVDDDVTTVEDVMWLLLANWLIAVVNCCTVMLLMLVLVDIWLLCRVVTADADVADSNCRPSASGLKRDKWAVFLSASLSVADTVTMPTTSIKSFQHGLILYKCTKLQFIQALTAKCSD